MCSRVIIARKTSQIWALEKQRQRVHLVHVYVPSGFPAKTRSSLRRLTCAPSSGHRASFSRSRFPPSSTVSAQRGVVQKRGIRGTDSPRRRKRTSLSISRICLHVHRQTVSTLCTFSARMCHEECSSGAEIVTARRAHYRQVAGTMTRVKHGLILVAIIALFASGEARIRDEPVERDGRALIPIAMDYGFEEEGTKRERKRSCFAYARGYLRIVMRQVSVACLNPSNPPTLPLKRTN